MDKKTKKIGRLLCDEIDALWGAIETNMRLPPDIHIARDIDDHWRETRTDQVRRILGDID